MKISITTKYPKPTSDYIEFGQSDIQTSLPNFVKNKWIGSGDRNYEFNKRVYSLFPKRKILKILDIGCGYGEAVEDFIRDGHIAIGIDGHPNYSKVGTLGWQFFPNNFFQCDVGQLFELKRGDKRLIFDLIMSWECFEHIKTCDIDKLMINIDRHSQIGSIFVGSISIVEEGFVHRTLQKPDWWLGKFHMIGFHFDKSLRDHFNNQLIRNLGGISDYYFLRKDE